MALCKVSNVGVNNSYVRASDHSYIQDPGEIQLHHFIVSLVHPFHFQHSGIDMVETRAARRARELSERFNLSEPLATNDPRVTSTFEDTFDFKLSYSRRALADPKVRFPNSNHFSPFIHTNKLSIHLLPCNGHRSRLSPMAAKPDDGLWPKVSQCSNLKAGHFIGHLPFQVQSCVNSSFRSRLELWGSRGHWAAHFRGTLSFFPCISLLVCLISWRNEYHAFVDLCTSWFRVYISLDWS
jgi:hypothetical protein